MPICDLAIPQSSIEIEVPRRLGNWFVLRLAERFLEALRQRVAAVLLRGEGLLEERLAAGGLVREDLGLPPQVDFLYEYVARHNQGVRTGDWEPMGECLADDARLEFDGVPAEAFIRSSTPAPPEPEPMAMISAYLRSSRTLRPEDAEALDDIRKRSDAFGTKLTISGDEVIVGL